MVCVSVRRGLRPTEQTDPTKRTASFLCRDRDAENHTSGEKKITRYKPADAVCSAAKPVCRVLSDGSRWWAYKSLSPSAPKHQTNSHSSSDWLPAWVLLLPLHSRSGPPTSWFPGGLEFNLSRAPSEDKHTHVFGLPKSLELDCRGAPQRVYLLRKWRAKGETTAHHS